MPSDFWVRLAHVLMVSLACCLRQPQITPPVKVSLSFQVPGATPSSPRPTRIMESDQSATMVPRALHLPLRSPDPQPPLCKWSPYWTLPAFSSLTVPAISCWDPAWWTLVLCSPVLLIFSQSLQYAKCYVLEALSHLRLVLLPCMTHRLH